MPYGGLSLATDKNMSSFGFVISHLVLLSLVTEMFTFDVCTEDNSTEIRSYYAKNVTTKHCGCEVESCVRKCCKPGFFYREKNCLRNNSTDLFKIPVHVNKTVPTSELGKDGRFLVGLMNCRYFRINPLLPNEKFYVQEDGTTWVPIYREFYKNSEYCVDELFGASILLCFPSDESKGREINVVGMSLTYKY